MHKIIKLIANYNLSNIKSINEEEIILLGKASHNFQIKKINHLN